MGLLTPFGPQALMSTWNPTTVVTQLEFMVIMTASATALVIAVALVPIAYYIPSLAVLPHPFPYTRPRLARACTRVAATW